MNNLRKAIRELGFKKIKDQRKHVQSFQIDKLYLEYYPEDIYPYAWVIGNKNFDIQLYPGGCAIWDPEELKEYVNDYFKTLKQNNMQALCYFNEHGKAIKIEMFGMAIDSEKLTIENNEAVIPFLDDLMKEKGFKRSDDVDWGVCMRNYYKAVKKAEKERVQKKGGKDE